MKFIFRVIMIKLLFLLSFSLISFSYADNHNIYETLQNIQNDLKTLERAVYSGSIEVNKSSSENLNVELDANSEDVLTRHLLKLSEVENQFRELTNKFEEINFKIDKLSTRVTKIQSDTQLRLTDIENNTSTDTAKTFKSKKQLPGTSKPKDFGAIDAYQTKNLPDQQQTSSVGSTASVITSDTDLKKSLLPNKPPKEQYEFAISFMKIGDYETAEFALKEFIEKNQEHDLAGNAQYWYGETFRIRQLYSDAATAYLDGYQNYPKSDKAPDNLLKLGITMVQLGEKEQGCTMITGIKKQYPKASKSVLQKAQYEQKKFNCTKS